LVGTATGAASEALIAWYSDVFVVVAVVVSMVIYNVERNSNFAK
jgi:hypothetical protein